MRGWFARMGQKMAVWMYGRYGNDDLNRFLTVLSLILLVISFIPVLWFLWGAALVLLIWSYVRMFSRKLDKRRRENERYLKMAKPFRDFFKLQKNKFRDRKTHVYCRCKRCRAVLRVPRGRGKIDITCPKCKSITVKKT